MSENSSRPPQEALPENLKKLLMEYRSRLWRAKILEAILAGFIGLAVSFLLVFLLDRVTATSSIFRLAILISGTSLMAIFAPIWLRRWVWGHRKENELARLIAKKHPDFGDRLLGIIELQQQNESRDSMSPRLRKAAMETVAAQAEKQGLGNALPKNWIPKAALVTAILVAGMLAAFLIAPQASVNAFKRWSMPLANTERYTFTKLDAPPAQLVVAHGESFDFTLRLAADTQWQPATAQVRFGAAPPVVAPLVEGRYTFSLPAQFAPNDLAVIVGDFRHSTRILPTLRPTINYAVATIRYPEYLQQSDQTVDLKTGVVTAVNGSTVQMELTASRTLSSAELGPVARVRIDDEPNLVSADTDQSPGDGFKAALTTKGSLATSAPLPVSTKTYDVPFSWIDEYKLAGDNAFRIRVEGTEDAPPVAYIQGVEKQIVLLPEETIDFDVLAEDDFGLTELGLEWYGEAAPNTSSNSLAKGELKLQTGSPTSRQLTNPTPFCPQVHNIAPQKLILRAYTKDYHPDRKRTYSEPITLFILTRDEHAQLLKNQFDRVVGELEDAARREQNSFEENQRLERKAPEDLQSKENQAKLQEQQKQEQENTERMKDLQERMEKLLKDAARNGEIDKDVMKKMAESMKSLSELSKEDMPKVEKKLSDSQQQNSTPEQTKKDVQDAVKEQKDVVEKMKKTLAEARDANKNMEASTFVNRFKRAASEESSLASDLSSTNKRYEEGLDYMEVDPSVQSILQDVSRRQSANLSDIRWIEEDLANFYTRTNKEVYKQILDEMRGINDSTGIANSLEGIRLLLEDNLSLQFRNGANYWSDRLNGWAKKLEGEKDKEKGEGGDGPPPDQGDQDFEFMLRVMKMIQKQQDIRASTRALEELKRSTKLP